MKQNSTRREFIKTGIGAVAGMGTASSFLSGCNDPAYGSKKHDRPNILFLFSDQHNASVLGCDGHVDVKTPYLDRFSQEGVRFSRAYCQDGVCVPSRTTIMTGQYPRSTGVLYNPNQPPQPETLKPLAKLLNENGYRTAAFGKRHLPKSLDVGFDITCTTLPLRSEPSDECYWDWIRDQGQWEAFKRDWNAEHGHRLPGNQAAKMGSLISDLKPENTMEAYTAKKTIEFIRQSKKEGRPFFCWSSFYRPHQPYTPTKYYADMYDPAKIKLPESLNEPIENLPPQLRMLRRNESKPWCLALAAKDENLYRRYIANYYALITEIDDHISSIMKALKSEGLEDDTIVVYASDHGDFIGHHGMIEKMHQGHNIYEDTLRVPLIFRWPGRFCQQMVIKDLVELVDFYPTLLDLIGIDKPTGYNLPGKSLVPTLTKGHPVERDIAISENWGMLTAISKRYKLGAWIEQQEGNYSDMLFDRVEDPLELNNLVGKPQVADIENQLRRKMAEWIERTPNVTGKQLRPLTV